MKLFELDANRQTKQAAKVFESYFGSRVSFDQLTRPQARNMLNRVRSLIKEHRATTAFHTSEQNPTYLKLVVMEQGLAAKMREDSTVGMNQPAGAGAAPTQGVATAAGAAAANPVNSAMQMAQKKKEIQSQIQQKQKEIADLQKQMSNPMAAMAESRRMRRLAESEIQQAQVVLAAQDMVDQVQKMLEQVTSMQFKDLPALVDQVKNQVGVDQAMQFNTDATAALTGLTQNLQASKQQLDQALAVVTGQAATVPGADAGAPAPDLGAEPPLPGAEAELDVEIPPEGEELPPEEPVGAADLGRQRR